MSSVSIIITEENLAESDSIVEAAGEGANAFSIKLSATGSLPVTHYGLHQWEVPSWIDSLPEPTIVSISEGEPRFWEVAADNGLYPIDETPS